jgi:hypothetical protein
VHFGTEQGDCSETVLATSRYSLLQQDHDRYGLTRTDWDGDVVELAHGAASGGRAPGWVQVLGSAGEQLSLHLPGFADEYPNELALAGDSLEVGLWPAAANAGLAAKRILPANADPAERHRDRQYRALLSHPYLAFFDPERGCLETVQGMQKTQELIVDTTPLDLAGWQARVAERDLELPLALPHPRQVDHAGVLGRISSVAADPQGEAALERATGWFARHRAHFGVRGKFDLGDLRYLAMSPYATQYRHRSLKTHPRIHYWNNNEEDPIHGLFLAAWRRGDAAILDLVAPMGRHLWDVDVRHYPYWGMHTHSGGHCFRSIADRATDHFWVTALIDYYVLTGDPDVLAGVEGLAAYAAEHLTAIRYAETNLREVTIAVMQAVEYHAVLHRDELLVAAEEMAAQMLAEQHPDGYFPGFGAQARGGGPEAAWPHALFGTLAVEALCALDQARPRPEWREAVRRQLDWFLARGLLPAGDGLNARPRPDGARPAAGQGYEAGYHDYKLADFQLLKGLGYAIRWMLQDGAAEQAAAYQRAGDRILARLIRLQLDASYGPAYEGNWNESEPIADPEGQTGPPTASRPRDPVDPSRCPYQVRPLCASAALRCLSHYLAARRPATG